MAMISLCRGFCIVEVKQVHDIRLSNTARNPQGLWLWLVVGFRLQTLLANRLASNPLS